MYGINTIKADSQYVESDVSVWNITLGGGLRKLTLVKGDVELTKHEDAAFLMTRCASTAFVYLQHVQSSTDRSLPPLHDQVAC